MRSLTLLAPLCLLAAACATVKVPETKYGTFIDSNKKVERQLATEAVARLASAFPKKNVTFEFSQSMNGDFGRQMSAGLNRRGYEHVVYPREGRPPCARKPDAQDTDGRTSRSVPVCYLLDKVADMTRLRLDVAGASWSRLYTVDDNDRPTPVGGWTEQRND